MKTVIKVSLTAHIPIDGENQGSVLGAYGKINQLQNFVEENMEGGKLKSKISTIRETKPEPEKEAPEIEGDEEDNDFDTPDAGGEEE